MPHHSTSHHCCRRACPPPAAKWTGLAKYSFVGGNNDPEQVPLDGLIDAVNAVLKREGRTLATYGLESGPQGYRPLRQFLSAKLKRDGGISCTADDILIVSGSLQALDLVNADFSRPWRYRHRRARHLSGHVEPADAAWGQHDRHPARSRRHADGCVGRHAGRSQTPRRHAEIYLHHPDRAEPDRHHHAGSRRARTAGARRAIWRADLRGRLLRRSDLGRKAPAGAPCHEQDRQRHPHRLILQIDRAGACASASSSRHGRCCRACWRSKPMPAAARSSRWCSPNIARRISRPTCRA